MKPRRRSARAVDERLVSAVERLSILFRYLLWDAAKVEKLSPIQIQFLLYLGKHSGSLCTVSRLAREFGLTKATVSDAVKALLRKGLLVKTRSAEDGRSSTLRLSVSGRRVAAKLEAWPDVVKRHLGQFPPDAKENVMVFLMDLIGSLQRAGVIEVARMCLSCGNFRRNIRPGAPRPHECTLTGRAIGNADLKIDCDLHACAGP
jgi:DNA-binding MarR family transcriptional regulator